MIFIFSDIYFLFENTSYVAIPDVVLRLVPIIQRPVVARILNRVPDFVDVIKNLFLKK